MLKNNNTNAPIGLHGGCARTAKWRWPMPLCVSDVISSVISVPSASKALAPTPPLTSQHVTRDSYLYLKVSCASRQHPHNSLIVCLHMYVHTTMMVKNKQLMKYKAASLCQRPTWWWWWTQSHGSQGSVTPPVLWSELFTVGLKPSVQLLMKSYPIHQWGSVSWDLPKSVAKVL